MTPMPPIHCSMPEPRRKRIHHLPNQCPTNAQPTRKTMHSHRYEFSHTNTSSCNAPSSAPSSAPFRVYARTCYSGASPPACCPRPASHAHVPSASRPRPASHVHPLPGSKRMSRLAPMIFRPQPPALLERRKMKCPPRRGGPLSLKSSTMAWRFLGAMLPSRRTKRQPCSLQSLLNRSMVCAFHSSTFHSSTFHSSTFHLSTFHSSTLYLSTCTTDAWTTLTLLSAPR